LLSDYTIHRLRPASAAVIIVSQMRRFFTVLILLAGPLPMVAAGQPVRSSAQADSTPGYYFMLGRHLETAGDIAGAIAAHKRAIELAPESAELRAELAGVYARQDRAPEAVQAAQDGLRIDPANREANRILGSVYAAFAEQGRPITPGDDPKQYTARAIAALEKARRDGIFDASLDLMLGRLYLQAGNVTAAIPALKTVVDDQPGYPDASMLLAAALEGAGRIDDAIGTLERSLQDNPTFSRGRVRLAELYEKQHRYADAAEAYAQAQAADPRADTTAERAAALINAKKAGEARVLLEAALARTPAGDPGLLYLLGQAQRQLKDSEGAAGTAQKLAKSFPGDPRSLYLQAQLLEDKGDKVEALGVFKQLIALAPNETSFVYEYANLLEMTGRKAEAEHALRDLVARDPEDADALNSLGYMLAERGEGLDEAVDLLRRALKVDPTNPSYLDSLGWAYCQQGKLDLAEAPLAQAAAELPQSSAVQAHLGDLRFKQQRYGDAAAAWERALAGDGQAIDRAEVEKKLREVRARIRK
jgi:tetratricopeptide (TPR) repeat protein